MALVCERAGQACETTHNFNFILHANLSAFESLPIAEPTADQLLDPCGCARLHMQAPEHKVGRRQRQQIDFRPSTCQKKLTNPQVATSIMCMGILQKTLKNATKNCQEQNPQRGINLETLPDVAKSHQFFATYSSWYAQTKGVLRISHTMHTRLSVCVRKAWVRLRYSAVCGGFVDPERNLASFPDNNSEGTAAMGGGGPARPQPAQNSCNISGVWHHEIGASMFQCVNAKCAIVHVETWQAMADRSHVLFTTPQRPT